MGCRGGAGNAAGDLRIGNSLGEQREGTASASAACLSSAVQSIVAAVKPRRRAGLQPAEREAGRASSDCGQRRWPAARRSGRPEPGARRYGSGRAGKCRWSAPPRRSGASPPSAKRTPVTRPPAITRSATSPSTISRPGCAASAASMACAVELAVGLGARTAHRRTLRPVEQPELDARPHRPPGPSARRARRSRAPDGPCRGRRSPDCTTSRRWRRGAERHQRVRAPSRAAAAAASQPAWPPPMTMTS